MLSCSAESLLQAMRGVGDNEESPVIIDATQCLKYDSETIIMLSESGQRFVQLGFYFIVVWLPPIMFGVRQLYGVSLAVSDTVQDALQDEPVMRVIEFGKRPPP